MIHCHFRSHVILVGLVCIAVPARAADKAAFTMPVAQFRQLDPAEQKALLLSAFEHRLEHAKNLYLEVQLRMGGHEYKNGQIGKQVFELNGRNYRLWRLGDSYRIDAERGGVYVAKPNEFLSSGFDPRKGVGKSTARFSGNDQTFGRIDTVPDTSTEDNRLAYWLDGRHVPVGEYLFRYLVDHKDSYTIEVPNDQNMVRLTVPWQTIYSTEAWGKKEFILDPSKGFLPVKGKARWETDKLSVGSTSWRTEEFVVEASQLVGDVWMPTELKELIGSSNGRADTRNVLESKVTKIQWGAVVPKDLEIHFLPGMKVIDAIKGETYVVGSNGEPTLIERVVGAREGVNLPKASTLKKNVLFIWIGAGLLIVIAMLVVWKVLKKSRATVKS
jgi:hypothetical protein